MLAHTAPVDDSQDYENVLEESIQSTEGLSTPTRVPPSEFARHRAGRHLLSTVVGKVPYGSIRESGSWARATPTTVNFGDGTNLILDVSWMFIQDPAPNCKKFKN